MSVNTLHPSDKITFGVYHPFLFVNVPFKHFATLSTNSLGQSLLSHILYPSIGWWWKVRRRLSYRLYETRPSAASPCLFCLVVLLLSLFCCQTTILRSKIVVLQLHGLNIQPDFKRFYPLDSFLQVVGSSLILRSSVVSLHFEGVRV